MASEVTRARLLLETLGHSPIEKEDSVQHGRRARYRYSVAANTSQTVDLTLFATAATVIFVKSNKTFSVTANGADTAQTYSATGFHLQQGTSVTALVIKNTHATETAEMEVVAVGD